MIVRQSRPSTELIRHFLSGLFDLGFLSEAGVVSFTQALLGIGAAFLSFGFLLVRVYFVKYASLMGARVPGPYRDAVLADHAFLLAVLMWIVAFVSVLTGHALFPDARDFRVLGALPLTRRQMFMGKLSAVALFVGGFVAAATVALFPLFVLTSIGPWTEGTFLGRCAAYLVAALLSATFTILAAAALQGTLLLAFSHERAQAVPAVVRSVLICSLVLSLPFLFRLPAAAPAFAGRAGWLYASPPAWFLGLERALMGDARFVPLAGEAGAAFAGAAIVAIGSYAALYRHFERIIVRASPGAGNDRAPRGSGPRKAGSSRSAAMSVCSAVRTFTFITLRRSVLHQGVVAGLSAIGAGLALNTLLTSRVFNHSLPVPAQRAAVDAVTWAPFALMFAASLAARTALMVPIELRANWMFRMVQSRDTQPDQLRAGVRSVRDIGLLLPAALMFPVQCLVLGWRAVGALAVGLGWGLLLLEILMRDWNRVPFTCSYIPGRGFVPQTILTGLVSFLLFTTFGAVLVQVTIAGHGAAVVLNGLLLIAVSLLRWRRLRAWSTQPLAFEDQLPVEVDPLRLFTD